jgi:hypothetical protein
MTGSSLRLKQPTGWFAAGREVAEALSLLSDGAFKLFMWICLNADRGLGAIRIEPGEIARVLGKTEAEIRANLRDLFLVINRPMSGRHALGSNRKRYSFSVDDFLLGGKGSSSGVIPGKVTVRLEPSLHDSLYPTFGRLAQPRDGLGGGVRRNHPSAMSHLLAGFNHRARPPTQTSSRRRS